MTHRGNRSANQVARLEGLDRVDSVFGPECSHRISDVQDPPIVPPTPVRLSSDGDSAQHRELCTLPRLLFIGAYVPAPVANQGIGQVLAQRMAMGGWPTRIVSRHRSRYRRVVDILVTTWRTRSAFEIALVDVYSGAALRWAEAVCRLLGWMRKPYVLTLHGGDLPALARRSPRRLRRLLAGARAVVAPSTYLASSVRALRPDVRVHPNAIDLEAYPFRLRGRAAPRLVWVRAFHKVYNPTLALRVAARVARHDWTTSLTMVGPDKDGSAGRIRTQAKALGLEQLVALPGGVAKHDVPRFLSAADIFLNTANVDNTPVSVIEAMACGLCVVSTAVGGIPHLLENEVDALLVPPNDAEAMAHAVHRILSEPGLASRLSANARHKAEHFGWKRVLPLWSDLIAGVVRRGVPA